MRNNRSLLVVVLLTLGLASCKTSTDPGTGTGGSGNVVQPKSGSTFTYSASQNGSMSTIVHTVSQTGMSYQNKSGVMHITANQSGQQQDAYMAYDNTGDLEYWAPLDLSTLGLTPTWVRFPFGSGQAFHLSQDGNFNGQNVNVTYDITSTAASKVTVKGTEYTAENAHLVMAATMNYAGQTVPMSSSTVDYSFIPQLGYFAKINSTNPPMVETLTDFSLK